MKNALFFFITFTSFFSIAQTVNYNDVAVIVNSNSQTSIDIANHFQAARNIPAQNMIYISALTSEEIDSAQFEAIRAQIEGYLVNNNLADSINYLVTTKGVPLKVVNTCFGQQTGVVTISCASFDSELCLILGSNASEIGKHGSVTNPVFESTQHFSRSTFGTYLVTRLTGCTKQDVFNMIDRSGPETGINRTSAQAVLDINNATGSDSSYFHDLFVTPAEDYLTTNSWNNLVNLDTTPAQNQENIFAYMAYESVSSFNVSLNHTWTDGSVGAISSCNSASTFEESSNTDNQLLLGDLIAEGCTGAHGFVNCVYFSQILRSHIFFDRYLNQTDNYNLAESFYMAEPRMSWQAIVVGDPKASVVIDNTAGIDDSEEITLRFYPNPTNGILHVSSSDLISSVEVFGANGVLMKSLDSLSESSVEIDLHDLKPGMYLLSITSRDQVKVERIVVAE